ncbi:hypothetical protein PCANC_27524 [Puccinia coronata f. sp. avenae]|uniref:DUF6589 domain-containing protein n=1 Tax=Puccinia coronata f. sp. avenae TaxID=200324 RepID=A0A2N5S733_9BASI|nr:hypothetical protein PCANC_27524 [Puccinia coronata f. sp. avenae]
MVAFVFNRWNNGKQLANSITLLACGVTDRVNAFLRYIGLSSSLQTAHNALKRLSYQSERQIGFKMMSPLEHPSLAPFLCLDNLDFEQKVHTKSLGNSNHMFHGIWGYVHQLNPKLLASVPSSKLTLESYNQSMLKVSDLQVQPRMFVPQPKENLHWTLVLKSQIAQAMLEHVAEASDSKVSIATQPPVIDQISPEEPDITMLKLMIALDNSSQGVGEVFEAIVNQSRLSMTEFANLLQIINANLASCTNVSSLQTKKFPETTPRKISRTFLPY